MIRLVLAGLLALLPLAAWMQPARAQTEQQALVDRATLTVQEMFTGDHAGDRISLLRRAKGALICPRVFKAGFILGGSGGGCVLVSRGPAGWSNPAFYTIGSGSFGLQAGVQDSQIVFLVLTERGLHAILDSQFKIGADASIAVATIGAGVEGATTAALRADIVAFAKARGLFAGVSVQGSIISADSGWNQTYYGSPLAAPQIILQGEGSNPGTEPLRQMLLKFSG
jgi:lipid-binding SYLF domain-containing protein